ncbi:MULTISPECIES: hypothetical protein [Gammaproteobacteria]|uniref:hypothetical protein n=1 Tax=Gammaproteobacteria TaxID=1236 RepID=UPI000DD002AB|nr:MULTISPECIES: hypothetical protein [Gammaproteobacteria]RTE86615.1 hypothetical protein DQX04_08660 [Aliidiomarina sp. B3213]TCZ90830.1 hypothetical protein EYQ95_08385 [Lysobacter sp. N42]
MHTVKSIITLAIFSFSTAALSVPQQESDWITVFENDSIRLLSHDIEDASEIRANLLEAERTFTDWFVAPEKIDIFISDSQSTLGSLPELQSSRHLALSRETLAAKKGPDRTFAAIIAHETCHLWFIDYVTSQGIPQTSGGQIPAYGHGQINDWLDETIAVACEQGDVAQSRRDQDFPITPLEQYLTNKHPVYAQIEARVAAILAARQGNGSSQQTIRLTTDDNELIHFYLQSAHFGDFIFSRTTPEQRQQLIRYAQPDSDIENLASFLEFDSIGALSEAFQRFVED